MIDVHCHILPGIDDGSPNMDASIEMARLLAEHGYEGVIATPHVMADEVHNITKDFIAKQVEDFREALDKASVKLDVYVGAEYYLDRSVADLTREFFPLTTMADTYYILVEMPVTTLPSYLDYSVLAGPTDSQEFEKLIPYLRPVIAHPERNEKIAKNTDNLLSLRNRGYFLQSNLEPIIGGLGRGPKKLMKKMAARGLIDLIGTDGHSPEKLAKILPDFRKKVEKIMGDKRARQVLEENSDRLVKNKLIEWDD